MFQHKKMYGTLFKQSREEFHLPPFIVNKHACVILKGVYSKMSLLRSVVAAVHPVSNHEERATNCTAYMKAVLH